MRSGPLYAVSMLIASGCASKAAPPAEVASPPESRSGYHVYYADSDGVGHFDVTRGRSRLVAPASGGVTASRPSPDGSWLGVAYADADSTRVVLLEAATSRLVPVLSGPPEEKHTLAWAPSGDQLAVGHFTLKEVSGRPVPDRGDIASATLDGSVRRVGCRVAKRVEAWLAGGQLVVGDGWNLYVVRADNCRTLATLRLGRRHAVQFSPAGEHVAYLEPASGRGSGGGDGSALYVAEYTGRNPKLVVGAEYAPERARWSPDGKQIAFDVRSPEDPSVRHVAVYDLERGGTSFYASQTARGTPQEWDPHWSPDGGVLIHDRTFGSSDSTEKIIRTVRIGPDALQVAPRVVMEGAGAARTLGWVDNSAVLVAVEDSAAILNTEVGTTLPMPAGRILHVLAP